jgi:hypothetical protein
MGVSFKFFIILFWIASSLSIDVRLTWRLHHIRDMHGIGNNQKLCIVKRTCRSGSIDCPAGKLSAPRASWCGWAVGTPRLRACAYTVTRFAATPSDDTYIWHACRTQRASAVLVHPRLPPAACGSSAGCRLACISQRMHAGHHRADRSISTVQNISARDFM